MSRFLGPRLRIIRRLGKLPGLTTKKSQRENSPGQHGTPSPGQKKKKRQQNRPGQRLKDNSYANRLKEKQKLRYHYGITERQLLNSVRRAKKISGSTGKILLEFLEMRLDCIIYRLRLTPSIRAARQLVNHGHVQVNGRTIDIPSYICQVADQIRIKDRKSSISLAESQIRQRQESCQRLYQWQRRNRSRRRNRQQRKIAQAGPRHLQGAVLTLKGKSKKGPSKQKSKPEIGLMEGMVSQRLNPRNLSLKVNKRLIVEYYSRKI